MRGDGFSPSNSTSKAIPLRRAKTEPSRRRSATGLLKGHRDRGEKVQTDGKKERAEVNQSSLFVATMKLNISVIVRLFDRVHKCGEFASLTNIVINCLVIGQRPSSGFSTSYYKGNIATRENNSENFLCLL